MSRLRATLAKLAAAANAAMRQTPVLFVDTKHNLSPDSTSTSGFPRPEAGRTKPVPYSAVIYDYKGSAWTYTNPAPLTYVRHPIDIEYVKATWRS